MSSVLASVSPFAFVDGALDRADALRDDSAALQRLWPDAGVIVLTAQGNAWVDAEQQFLMLQGEFIPGGAATHTFLGTREGRAWFFVEASTLNDPPEVNTLDLRTAAAHWPAWQATLFAQARALQHWHQQHRFCAACAGALVFERAGWLGRCQACQREHYPRTDQAIIVAITDGQRLLLGRQATWPARRWSVVAGFVEPGETLEQTVAREVMEETSVRVRTETARYIGSQPWPFPSSLMLGFIAEAEPDEPQAHEELEAAAWFSADEVRAALQRDWMDASDEGEGIVLASPVSIARHVIQYWLDAYDQGQLAK